MNKNFSRIFLLCDTKAYTIFFFFKNKIVSFNLYYTIQTQIPSCDVDLVRHIQYLWVLVRQVNNIYFVYIVP